MNQFLKTTEQTTVENYPYGYTQKTTAFYSLEFNAKKGFRSVFQTVNPKTGKLNAPKKSTYYPLMAQYIESETGHIKTACYDFNGDDRMNNGCKFMYENFDLFTPEQIKHVYAYVAMMLKVSAKALIVYTGADEGKTIEVFKPFIEKAVEGFKSGQNVFNHIVLPINEIEALKVPDFQPFRVKNSFIIDGEGVRPLSL